MKHLEIEWRHFAREGNTCVRCADTGEALDAVVEELAVECRPCGWEITFKEATLGEKDISKSNVILFNGVPIEDVLPKASVSPSHCESCCEFTGVPTLCRTVEFEGQSFAAVPASLIRRAVCTIAHCC